MKKRFTAIIAFLLTMALIISGRAITIIQASAREVLQNEVSTSSFTEQILAQYGDEYWENLKQARSNNTELMTLFAENYSNTLLNAERSTTPQESGDPTQPDAIGGVYFNKDGNMVLQIDDDTAIYNSALYNLVVNFSAEKGIITETVEFSHNEIKATMNALNELYLQKNRPAAFNNVDWFAEDTINNRIEVRLATYSEEEIARFKNTINDSPIISFVKSTSTIQTTECRTTVAPSPTAINPGQRINIGTGFASAGYRAKLSDGTVGFVTAGHTPLTLNQSIEYGTVRRQQFGGTVDAAFIATNSNFDPTNIPVDYSYVLATVRSSFYVGDPIVKVGATTLVTTGTVTSTNVSSNNVTGLVATSVNNNSGDSGGVVIALVTVNLGPPAAYTAGIVHGAQSSNGNIIPNTLVFCKASVINSAFGISRY